MASTSPIKQAAAAIRAIMLERPPRFSRGSLASALATSIGDLLRTRAKATDTALVRGQGVIEVFLTEVRP
jgi:hypothetical protein